MPTRTYKYAITTYTGDNISRSTGKQLNLNSDFTVSGDTTSKMGRVTSVTCSFPIVSTSHRSGATIQTTFSNTSTSTTYASDVVTKTLSSGGGYVATVNHTWATPPPASFFNDAANTTVSIVHTNTSVGKISLRGKTYYVTITVEFETGPTCYVYDGGWKEATPYIYTSSGWQVATVGVYSGGWL